MKPFLKKYYASLGRFRALYVISAIELIVMVSYSAYTGAGMSLHPDTPYYYDSYDTIMTGHIDVARTPLYPLVIGISRDVFGSTMSTTAVYVFQSMIFLFSIKWIGRTLRNITRHGRIAYWFTAAYALYPGILAFCGVILTESLAVSLMSAVLCLVSEAYFHNSHRKALLSGMACVLLWMLRPSMMAVPVLLALMWLLLLMSRRKGILRTASWGLSSAAVSVVLLGVYAIAFEKEHHKAGVTWVSTINNYMTIRGAGVVHADEVENPGLRAGVDSVIRVNGPDCGGMYWWDEAYGLCCEYGLGEFDRFVSTQMRSHPEELMRFLYRERLESLLDSSCVYTGGAIPPPLCSLTRLIRVSNGTAFLIFFLGMSLLAYSDIKRKRFSCFEWLLLALFAANYLTVWIGAPGEFGRLLAQNYPVLIAISCWVLDRLCALASLPKTLHLSNGHSY